MYKGKIGGEQKSARTAGPQRHSEFYTSELDKRATRGGFDVPAVQLTGSAKGGGERKRNSGPSGKTASKNLKEIGKRDSLAAGPWKKETDDRSDAN